MKKLFRTLLATAALVVGGSSLATPFVTQAAEPVKVKLGLTGDDTRVWDNVKERLAKEGIEIEYVKFTDYSQPNAALADGSIDLNAFQHQIFLDSYNAEHKTDIVSIGNTVNAPLGIYSDKIKDVKDLKEGAKIAIPNDPTNGGRALRLLQSAGLIKVDESKGYKPTVSDITENKLKLDIQELDASQTARALLDVDVAIINSGVAVDAGFLPTKDAIFLEPVDDKSKPYVNVIAVRKEDEQNDIYQKIVDFYQTDETKKVIEEVSKGSHIPAWETFGRK
ncbi:MetQ/NlpA family ABC transporter substrate-binding protein [Aerococcaceae bacterium NML190073]|nr:MetQ/NlpA family ABC transporter substrate-binding protein [Aerococcaceae bacterium NML190073]MCW6666299.1 MetQ/NlpA family ABC transporter substrate-binding protein [Aerococcaceae bacterium NML190938]